MEDPDSEETKEFVKSQVEVTESLLKTCETREKLKERLKEVFEFERFQVPFKRGDKYFYFHNKGLQPQDVLYVQVHSISLLVFSNQHIRVVEYFFNLCSILSLCCKFHVHLC